MPEDIANDRPDAQVITTRLNRLRNEVGMQGCKAILLSSPENIRYFSGFFSSTYSRPLLLIVPMAGEATLLLPSLEEGLARRYARVPWQTYRTHLELNEQVGELSPNNSLVALEHDSVPVSLYSTLMNLMPSSTFVDMGDVTLRMRAVKDGSELDLCRRAGSICRAAAEAAIAVTRAGVRELEIKAVGEEVGYREAANRFPGNRFWIWANVVAGCRTDAGGHDLASGRLVKPGDVVIHVWHTSCDGYWAVIVRTILVDEIHPQAETVHNVVCQVQESVIERFKVGVTCSDVARHGMELLDHHGLGKYFNGLVGRGIGLSWAELPTLSLGSHDVLQPGMVLRVECGVYVQGQGGFGVADTVLLSTAGNESLTG